jgi:rubrerythrin
MNLERLLVRCRAFERRAAAAYRAFAARTRHDPELCALWTGMARDEESHAEAIGRAAGWLDATERWHTNLDGWEEALDEIEARLADAESRDIGADVDRQLLAALALERTELDTLFNRLLRLLPASERPSGLDGHTAGLLGVAARRGTSPAVAFEATLLQAHNRLRHAS